jgi:CheY-like chemotaxis protein
MSTRILVVDDHIDAADSLRLLLHMKGFHAQSAHSGQAALDMAGKFQTDVILLDLGMPGLDGYQVAERLRGTPAVLVALTGYGQEEDHRRTSRAGFYHHMLKPVDPDELFALLTRIAHQAGPSSVPGTPGA